MSVPGLLSTRILQSGDQEAVGRAGSPKPATELRRRDFRSGRFWVPKLIALPSPGRVAPRDEALRSLWVCLFSREPE